VKIALCLLSPSCYDRGRMMRYSGYTVRGHRTVMALWLAGMVCLGAFSAQAARLLLRIKAVNPIENSQVVSIRSNLPQGVSSNDVSALDSLELGYDVQNDVYYVYKDVPLGPKAVEIFDVEINDIWVVQETELNALSVQAGNLAAKLAATEFITTGNALRQQVDESLAQIRKVQTENAIRPGVQPLQHITAYESNVKRLARVKRDVGHLENLVLETGQDPGALVGEDRRALRLRRDIELPKDGYGTVVIRITAQNTSPTLSRLVDVSSPLPPEIKAGDVIDPGELSVGVDSETGTAYVYLDDVEVGAGESIEFEVRIHDKWDINGPRITTLLGNASNLVERITKKEKFPSIERQLTSVMFRLKSIAKEARPDTLNAQYVAFYRDQAERVDAIEMEINRVRAALKPIEKTKKYGFPVKAPSMKTTWIIIYIILGFLAFLSLLFFLRWYGKTRDERMWEQLRQEREEGP
jgi:hypothetical protein